MTDVLSAGSRRNHIRREMPHYVYQLWGRRECIYIGVTSNLGQRLASHSKKDWWPDVARVVADLHVDKYAGLNAEKDLIQEHDPLVNRMSVLPT